MSIPGRDDAKAILDRAIALSGADQCTATLAGSSGGNLRFARNEVSTSGEVSDADLAVEVAFGKRVGTATINRFDDASLASVVRRAEELARLAPENPEFVEAIARQDYRSSATFAAKTAETTPEARARVAAACIEPCRREGLVAAGFFVDQQGFSAIATSKGNFGYQAFTAMDFTCTVRTADGHGSGWVARNLADASAFDVNAAIRTAMDKAKRSVGAKALEPGKYTVVFEPDALAPLIFWLAGGGFGAREADEGQSFLSKKGGGNRLGERLFDERVTIHADPWSDDVPVTPWDEAGFPRERETLVGGGKVQSLYYTPYWAQRQGKPALGAPGNLVMQGGEGSTLDLVRATRRGILVTRTHYVNIVDPQTVMLTGLTADGTFFIEDGEIRHPIRNLRFNESVVVALNNIEAIGRPLRVGTAPYAQQPLLLPPLTVRDFTFTSVSDAV